MKKRNKTQEGEEAEAEAEEEHSSSSFENDSVDFTDKIEGKDIVSLPVARLSCACVLKKRAIFNYIHRSEVIAVW